MLSRLFARLTDHRQQRAVLDGFAFVDEDFEQHAVGGRGDFAVHFIGADFEQRLESLHRVAFLLEPLADRALDDALAQLRHNHIRWHDIPSKLESRKGERRKEFSLPLRLYVNHFIFLNTRQIADGGGDGVRVGHEVFLHRVAVRARREHPAPPAA